MAYVRLLALAPSTYKYKSLLWSMAPSSLIEERKTECGLEWKGSGKCLGVEDTATKDAHLQQMNGALLAARVNILLQN